MRRGRAFALLLLAGVARAEDLTLEAERIVAEGGRTAAEGAVVVSRGADRVEADAAMLEGETVTLGAGRWVREGLGTLDFDAGTLDLAAGIGDVRGAVLRSEGLWLTADRLVLREDGSLLAEGVRASACDCDGPQPWGVSARSAVLEPGEQLTFRGGWVRVLGVPLIPVPWGQLPLERRSGLLPPVVGRMYDGWRIRAPLYLTLGRSADLTLAPEVRTDRGARLITETRWAQRAGVGEVELAGGWDDRTGSVRGGAGWRQQWARQQVQVATEGQLTSDAAYLADYRDEFLARQLPWTEARGLVGWRTVDVGASWLRHVAPEDELLVLRSTARRPAVDLPLGLLGDVGIEGTWAGVPEHGGDALLVGDVGVSRPTALGPVMVTPALVAQGGLADERFARGAAALRIALPAWRDAGSAFERLEPEIVGRVTTDGELTAGPGLLWRRSGKGVVELRGGLGLGTAGTSGHAEGFVQRGAVFARAQAQSTAVSHPEDVRLALGAAAVGASAGPIGVDAGWVYARDELLYDPFALDRDLHQASGGLRWTLPGPLAPFTLSGGLMADLVGETLLSRTAGVAWRHPTGCVSVAATGRVDVDRDWPEVGLRVDVLER